MIKAVFVDIDNTLLDFDACANQAIKLLFKEYGFSYSDSVFDVFLRTNNELWDRIEKGTLTKAELHKIRWKLIFEELGIECDCDVFEKRFIETIIMFAEPVTGAKEALCYLASKYPVYAVSNSGHSRQRERLEKADMSQYVKEVFLSEAIGYSKPRPEFFDGCFKELPNLLPEEVMIIGDSLSADIEGGGNYGMVTCWFNFAGDTMPLKIKPDYIISDLCEIKKIL